MFPHRLSFTVAGRTWLQIQYKKVYKLARVFDNYRFSVFFFFVSRGMN